MTLDKLINLLPGSAVAIYYDWLARTIREFDITKAAEECAFLATVAHESMRFMKVEENLNYSAAALTKTWPQRFPVAVAASYQRQPEKIANRAYALRGGNGPEESGDGWRNRGAGLIQLTFENNHAACATYFKIPRDKFAAWIRTPEGACRSAGWFWKVNRIAPVARAGDFDGVCDIVNKGKRTVVVGDSIGWADRLALYEALLKAQA